MNFDIEKSNDIFRKTLRIYGDNSAEALHWKNEKSQKLRYDIFCTIGELHGKSVLDMGAGLGDFYGYLKERNINCDYLGVDVLKEFVISAAKKFPDAKFEQSDLQVFKPKNNFDYVICCGALNVIIGDMEKLVRQSIKKLYSMSNIACGFNLLSVNARFKDSNLYNYEPEKILKYCMKLTPYISYRHDYLDNDFTIFMYKEQKHRV